MIKIFCWFSFRIQKRGGGGWTSVKYNIIEEKEDYKNIGLREFYYKLFEEEEGGGVREGLHGYPYLKRLIQFGPGGWVKQIAKMNEAVGEKNHVDKYGGKKHLVFPFRRQEFWKFIGLILLEVTYERGHNLWGGGQFFAGNKAQTKLHRYVRGKTHLHRVHCDIYRPHYCYA